MEQGPIVSHAITDVNSKEEAVMDGIFHEKRAVLYKNGNSTSGLWPVAARAKGSLGNRRSLQQSRNIQKSSIAGTSSHWKDTCYHSVDAGRNPTVDVWITNR